MNEVMAYKPEDQLNPIELAVQRVSMVKDLYSQVMVRDIHFGKIEGTDRDTLLLPGAQKICTMFKLSPQIKKDEQIDMGGGHREYVMTVALVHRETGAFWGDGTGSASTMESKFRYRWKAVGEVPPEYWESRDDPKWAGTKVKKDKDGRWIMTRRAENPDIADVYNTVRKMCFKRALVSGTITGTGVDRKSVV